MECHTGFFVAQMMRMDQFRPLSSRVSVLHREIFGAESNGLGVPYACKGSPFQKHISCKGSLEK